MNKIKALNIAVNAVNYFLTGQPPLDTFNQNELSPAIDVLWDMPKKYHKTPNEKTWITARVCILKLRRQFNKYPASGYSMRTKTLQHAAATLPALLENVQRDEDTWWQNFTREALEEAEQILAEQGAL